jgi:TRAP-type transport system small permease protein
VDKLKGWPRRIAEIAIQLLVAALGAILLVKSFGLIQRNTDVEWVSLPLSVALVYIPMPIAGCAVLLQAFAQIAEAIKGPVERDTTTELPL